ncbi:MAG: RES family NAD+ phosphorylase, partial [Gammaproteobacteria bacterium]
MDVMALPTPIELDWKAQYRIIPSTFPPINFFEDLVQPEDMDAAFYIESLTNDRLRQEVGDIALINAKDRIAGAGSSVIMAAFTHVGKPSRFTNGSYGVYYAAQHLETAIRETVYHRERFMQATQEAPMELAMRVYKGRVLKPMHDIRQEKYAGL